MLLGGICWEEGRLTAGAGVAHQVEMRLYLHEGLSNRHRRANN